MISERTRNLAIMTGMVLWNLALWYVVLFSHRTVVT